MVRETILKHKRDYFIKVKAALMKAIVTLAMRYPEPTKENITDPHAKAWFEIWGKFFEMEDNPGREPLFKAIARLSIDEPAHDPYYRDRMLCLEELFIEAVLNGKIKPRALDHAQDCCKDDKRGLGYERVKKLYYYPDFRDKLKELLK